MMIIYLNVLLQLIDYLDTGLFLYHRLIRKISEHISKGKILESVCL